MTDLNRLLDECVLMKSNRFPAQWRVEACPPSVWSKLEVMPGVIYHTGSKKEEAGWYVPHSFVDRDKAPFALEAYIPEQQCRLPSGIELREYQARAVTFLRRVTRDREGAILAAEPGLGKTITALHAAYLDGFLSMNGLVCGPAIAENTWCSDSGDAKKHYGLSITPLRKVKNPDFGVLTRQDDSSEGHGDANEEPNSVKPKWFFCHYGLLSSWFPWLVHSFAPRLIIFDESHNIANAKAACSEAARALSLGTSCEKRFLLTGTPIPNKRIELWHQLATAQPRQWGHGAFQFGLRYCDAQNDGAHWFFEGTSHDEELRERLRGVLLRYTSTHPLVSISLPRFTRDKISVSIDERSRKRYEKARANIVNYLQETGLKPSDTTSIQTGFGHLELAKNDAFLDWEEGTAKIVMFTNLISILSQAKSVFAASFIKDILEKHERVVVFLWRRLSADYLCDELRKCGIPVFGPVDGRVKREKRSEIADAFSKANKAVFIATRKAAGEAINNLTCADACVMVDLYWNTTSLMQAEARVHRDGSWFNQVTAYYLMAPDTIDEYMMNLLETKASAISTTTGDTSSRDLVLDLSPSKVDFDLDALCTALMQEDITGSN